MHVETYQCSVLCLSEPNISSQTVIDIRNDSIQAAFLCNFIGFIPKPLCKRFASRSLRIQKSLTLHKVLGFDLRYRSHRAGVKREAALYNVASAGKNTYWSTSSSAQASYAACTGSSFWRTCVCFPNHRRKFDDGNICRIGWGMQIRF
jgi:hypothetical protein